MFLLPFVLIFGSCRKEDITIYYAYIKNTTTHQIEIKPYSAGMLVTMNVITLSANQDIQIANGTIRGISQNSGFGSKYFANADSLKVTFDGLYSITHYFITPASFAPKYYLNTSTRNLGNKNSYFLNGVDLSKHRRENTYTYEFSEIDYSDAR